MGYLCRLFFRILILPWFRLVYRVRRLEAHHVPSEGGVLLMPNHVTYIDGFIYYIAATRKPRYVISDKYAASPAFGWFIKLFRAIPIDRSRPRDAIDKTAEALKAGDVVCIFPEGGLTRSGVINDLKRGFELIVKRSGAVAVPMYVDGLWESIFSYERQSYIKKKPRHIPCRTQVAFGKPIEAKDISSQAVFEGMLEASVDAFAKRRCFEKNFEMALLKALKKSRRQLFSHERRQGRDPREWTRAQMLAIASAIARRWAHNPADSRSRIGIMLPPGPMASVLNLGLYLAGKTPVNLPYELRAEQVEQLAGQMDELGIRTVITANALMSNLVDFWRGDEGRFIDITTELTAPGTLIMSQENLFSWVEPTWLASWRLDLKGRDRHREAIGMIESPDGEAIFLSSAELHRNTVQAISADFIRPGDVILSESPMHNIVGQLMQLWVPILNVGRTVGRSFSERQDPEALKALAAEQKVNLTAGNLGLYDHLESLADLPDLRQIMVFDSEADAETLEELENRIGKPITPCWDFHGRIATMSLPPEVNQPEGTLKRMNRKLGSVGRFLPGVAGKQIDGHFHVRFDSTLVKNTSDLEEEDNNKGKKKEKQPLQIESWLPVSDEAYIDAEGFLFLKKPAEKKVEVVDEEAEVDGEASD